MASGRGAEPSTTTRDTERPAKFDALMENICERRNQEEVLLLPVDRNSATITQARLTNRTAMYGLVRTVVWEGFRREAGPDSDRIAANVV